MSKIYFTFAEEVYLVEQQALKTSLLSIINSGKAVRYKQEINDLISNWNSLFYFKGSYFCFKNDSHYQLIKDIYIVYSEKLREKLIDDGLWYSITIEDQDQNKAEEIFNLFKTGKFRYNVDNGMEGILAEIVVAKFFKNKFFDKIHLSGFLDPDHDYSSSEIDSSDFYIKNDYHKEKKFDIKCATASHYVEITPKIIVEEQNKKDYYIVTKFMKDINRIIILGYYEHSDLVSFGISKVLYGTAYWGMKLSNTKNINKLFKLIEEES